jgi:hypothetical protein
MLATKSGFRVARRDEGDIQPRIWQGIYCLSASCSTSERQRSLGTAVCVRCNLGTNLRRPTVETQRLTHCNLKALAEYGPDDDRGRLLHSFLVADVTHVRHLAPRPKHTLL